MKELQWKLNIDGVVAEIDAQRIMELSRHLNDDEVAPQRILLRKCYRDLISAICGAGEK